MVGGGRRCESHKTRISGSCCVKRSQKEPLAAANTPPLITGSVWFWADSYRCAERRKGRRKLETLRHETPKKVQPHLWNRAIATVIESMRSGFQPSPHSWHPFSAPRWTLRYRASVMSSTCRRLRSHGFRRLTFSRTSSSWFHLAGWQTFRAENAFSESASG